MKILITICARGGSKGIPGKNIKPLNGQPLIGYSIAVAKEFQSVFEGTDIMLSTDSEEIIRVAGVYGLKSDYKRPEYLANDTVGKIDAIKDLVLYSESKQGQIYDYILDLDVTSPLRNLQDLKIAFDILRSDENAINLFSVSEAGRSPYFNMVEQKENGYYAQVKMPDNNVFTRQSAPQVYDLNASFYFYKRSFFDMGYKGAITDRSLVYKVPHICFDLDHPIDFEIISYLMSNNKLDFLL
ncbi:cytidylyltransferase domain-containing protein [Bacteroides fragilis]|uniref:acylneuraminate cytidylyltransferase family protein n=1 Tax=Bacteroides fragilis TaxID=817 RepID=UPI001C7019F3|nr:acylneuraminate cytidylyltransferase family protein [Bacteroides fragilis]MBW9276320.1 acylneuraminate cytidylyltransferase family protein [Bacteroides fragilis]MBW9277860.1 acylneuraminate cytidylyltransferase family protein [Bacteroides fragilis]